MQVAGLGSLQGVSHHGELVLVLSALLQEAGLKTVAEHFQIINLFTTSTNLIKHHPHLTTKCSTD